MGLLSIKIQPAFYKKDKMERGEKDVPRGGGYESVSRAETEYPDQEVYAAQKTAGDRHRDDTRILLKTDKGKKVKAAEHEKKNGVELEIDQLLRRGDIEQLRHQ